MSSNGTIHRQLLTKGDQKRRRVLGDAHVDRSLKNADAFTRPLQEFVTKYAWGDVWERSGLDDKTRSLLNIAMLTALRQVDELKTHTKGAIRNGCSPDEIMEVLIQAAVYAGAPAALSASRAVQIAIQEIGEI